MNIDEIMNIDELKKLVKKEMESKSVLLEKPELLKESSLSRLYQHMNEHDTAILTAYRNDPTDMSACVEGAEAPKEGESNQIRNRNLKATLLAMKYGVTKVDGSYIENFNMPTAKEVSEDSLFCVNLHDDSNFVETIQKLGEKYCQDSVLIIPMGAKGAFLLGTNNTEFPGYGESVDVGDAKFGEEAEFMSRVGGRPISMGEEKLLEVYGDLSRNQRMAVEAIARSFLKENKRKIKKQK